MEQPRRGGEVPELLGLVGGGEQHRARGGDVPGGDQRPRPSERQFGGEEPEPGRRRVDLVGARALAAASPSRPWATAAAA